MDIKFKHGKFTLALYERRESSDVRRFPWGPVIAEQTTKRLEWTLHEGNKLVADGVASTIHDTEAIDRLMTGPPLPKEPEIDRAPRCMLLGPFTRWLMRGGKG